MKKNLVSSPFSGKVKIDFDASKRAFFLSTVIFQSSDTLPFEVKSYVEARKNHSFKPYKTYFKLLGNREVELLQEIPFEWGFQPSFRAQVIEFRKLGAMCSQALLEIAVEEKVKLVEDHLFSVLLN